MKPATGVQKLAGRFVSRPLGGKVCRELRSAAPLLPVWLNGLGRRLAQLATLGLRLSTARHSAANPSLGTVEEFDQLAKACKAHGVLFAPHDNYIDFYPDAQGYSYDHIAFTQDRSFLCAPGSIGAERPSRIAGDRIGCVRSWSANLRQLRAAHSPTAYFIDVWSSARPYDCWTSDGSSSIASQTRRVWVKRSPGSVSYWARTHRRSPRVGTIN